MDSCTACKAKLIWSITPSGARAPIDYAPSERGNVLLLSPTGLGAVLSVTLTKDALDLARSHGLDLRTNHFATCIAAEDFRHE
jgi:hypothetical protein